MSSKVIFLAFLLGCTKVVEPDDIITPEDLAEIAEAYCLSHPELTCGHVYVCGGVEVCVLDEHPIEWPEVMYGECVKTPRHQGLCWWCCGEGCGAGCNAYQGCFCPTPAPTEPDAGVQ